MLKKTLKSNQNNSKKRPILPILCSECSEYAIKFENINNKISVLENKLKELENQLNSMNIKISPVSSLSPECSAIADFHTYMKIIDSFECLE